MSTYKLHPLEEYLKSTKIITINDNFKIRMNENQLNNYNNHLYDMRINAMKERIDKIISLNIKYPYNAKPVFYLYVAPTENFREIMDYPSYIKSEWGGKPVRSYDLDGFKTAYSQSDNILLWNHEISDAEDANSVHELAHLVHGMFYRNSSLLCEGFADAFTFYILNYENKVDGYKELLRSLKESDILTANDLLIAEENGTFNSRPMIPNKTCSFSIYYISSYLFVRGLIETIEKNKNINKFEAMQEFLNIQYNNNFYKQFSIFKIADDLNLDKDSLLNKKDIQLSVLEKIKRTNE